MTKKRLVDYIFNEYGIKFDEPFKDTDIQVFRHKGNRKWFALLMKISQNKLGVDGEKMVDVLNLKVDPLIKEPMLKKKGVYVAYHMNKVHWLTINLEEILDNDLFFLIDLSFDLTKPKRKQIN